MAAKNPNRLAALIREEEKAKNNPEQKELKSLVETAVVEFDEPIEWCGQTYERIEMNFGKLIGRDFESLEAELTALGIDVHNSAFNKRYLRYLAAKAAGVPADMLEMLPYEKYSEITIAAQRFLIAMG